MYFYQMFIYIIPIMNIIIIGPLQRCKTNADNKFQRLKQMINLGLPSELGNHLIKIIASVLIKKQWYQHKLKHQLYYTLRAKNYADNSKVYLPKFEAERFNDYLGTNNYLIGPPKSGRTEIVKDLLKKYFSKENIIIFGRPEKKSDYQDLIEYSKRNANTNANTGNIINFCEMNENNPIETLIENTYQYFIHMRQIQKLQNAQKKLIIIFDDVINDTNFDQFFNYYRNGRSLGISTFVISSQIFNFDNTFRSFTDYVYFHRFFLEEPNLNQHLFDCIYFTVEYIKVQSNVNSNKIKTRKNLFLVANNSPINIYQSTVLSWLLPERNLR